MRTLEASRNRCNILYSDQTFGSDLRHAVKNLETDPSPCEDGLRSVCWKVCRKCEPSIHSFDVPARRSSFTDLSLKLHGQRGSLSPESFILPSASTF